MLYAAPSVGAVLSGLVVASFTPLRRQGPLLLVSVALYGLSTAFFGLSHVLWISLLLLAGTGASDTVSAVIRNTIRQLNTPDRLRGRMTAVNSLFFVGGPQLGEVEAGVAARFLGTGPSVFVGGMACALSVLAVAGWARELWRYDD
jgi:MFS family permease